MLDIRVSKITAKFWKNILSNFLRIKNTEIKRNSRKIFNLLLQIEPRADTGNKRICDNLLLIYYI